MATKQEFLSGKAKWCFVHQPDQYGWRVTLYLNDESLMKFRAWQEEGLKTHLRKDDDGYHVILRRPKSKLIRGNLQVFDPPVVIDKDNKPIADLVGNGSDITCKVAKYTYTPPTGAKDSGVAIRLDGIKVENLIAYERSSLSTRQEKLIKGLDEQPPQQAGW